MTFFPLTIQPWWSGCQIPETKTNGICRRRCVPRWSPKVIVGMTRPVVFLYVPWLAVFHVQEHEVLGIKHPSSQFASRQMEVSMHNLL